VTRATTLFFSEDVKKSLRLLSEELLRLPQCGNRKSSEKKPCGFVFFARPGKKMGSGERVSKPSTTPRGMGQI